VSNAEDDVAAALWAVCGRRVVTWLQEIAGHAKRTRRFESFPIYGVGAAFASFLPPLPAFTSTLVADIV
jgi:hypothetical protein